MECSLSYPTHSDTHYSQNNLKHIECQAQHKANMHICQSANNLQTVHVNDTITESSHIPDDDKTTHGACTQSISSGTDQPTASNVAKTVSSFQTWH